MRDLNKRLNWTYEDDNDVFKAVTFFSLFLVAINEILRNIIILKRCDLRKRLDCEYKISFNLLKITKYNYYTVYYLIHVTTKGFSWLQNKKDSN